LNVEVLPRRTGSVDNEWQPHEFMQPNSKRKHNLGTCHMWSHLTDEWSVSATGGTATVAYLTLYMWSIPLTTFNILILWFFVWCRICRIVMSWCLDYFAARFAISKRWNQIVWLNALENYRYYNQLKHNIDL